MLNIGVSQYQTRARSESTDGVVSRTCRRQPQWRTICLNAASEEIANDAALLNRRIDYTLHVLRRNPSVPDASPSERMIGHCRRDVDDHIASPTVPTNMRDRADQDLVSRIFGLTRWRGRYLVSCLTQLVRKLFQD